MSLPNTPLRVLDRIGYVFNGLGKFEEALVVYQGAEALAVKYSSQRPYQAIALRGMHSLS
jgi:hypothetical protein